MQENEALARHAPLLEKISVDGDRIVLLDKVKNRVAEVVVQNGTLFCQLCEETDCLHVGYAFALPDVLRHDERARDKETCMNGGGGI